ncbi:hypothetical protein GUITHDRAFT_142464 [Guillardia theta CCMP2712]|uniref:Uncharacterized protein n=1 Tax=Guillardia theta (strain CCMP2712) TaxID=905079 RepID=L1IYE9_GUITC|nr:hypothetical protein GUITHDRAFT_142464 [Guillardia theta CCMP2712]EKX40845.1 hypothetical protein GUITHDRAFT_142464 [Guillardia theta CCMP2712]|mmetsp:Transcript_32360/g.102765  ORF Transcript_32360/g.102765 Transcript_32360/m.102765 type:complete len:157 (-) Transcript_32360:172-642(-)|eukprot:XP_005827825.1 hypothetical protein GUITHDRAFT_142464 [Guillardia theta CCMP2712]
MKQFLSTRCVWLGLILFVDLSLHCEGGTLLRLRGGGRGLVGAIRKSQRVTGKSHNLGCLTTLPSGYDSINKARIKYYNDYFSVVREKETQEGKIAKRRSKDYVPAKLHLMKPAKAKKLKTIHRQKMRELGLPLWSNPQRANYLKQVRESRRKTTRR